MRPRLSFFGSLSLLSAALILAMTGGATAQSCTSTVTGTVYSPKGPTAGDPIPNILVYAVADSQLPSFASQGYTGVPGGSCDPTQQYPLVPATTFGHATTDAYGNFTFVSDNLPASVNIVIQAGKWRRQYTGTQITQCATTTLPSLTLPANSTQGDLPHIAVSTGSADSIECIFHKIGISDSEVSSTGSIVLYEGKTSGGQQDPVLLTSTPSETVLESSVANLSAYDLVMFGCQGTTAPSSVATPGTNGTVQNLIQYANNGGRVFVTHLEWPWLATEQPFASMATWGPHSSPTLNADGDINTSSSFPEGEILSTWLHYIGADDGPGKILLTNIKQDTSGVSSAAQNWVTSESATVGHASMQFTFDTPIGASSATPTITLSYDNGTSSFLQGTTGDVVTVNVKNAGTVDVDPSLTITLSIPSGINPTSLKGSGTTGWVCNVSTLVCTRNQPLMAGVTDPVVLSFDIAADAAVGQAQIGAALTGGNLTNSAQCGRVLFNDYHVESSATKAAYGSATACKTSTLSPQEKFLEFSLYNLSNFISPVTEDNVDIQGPTTLAWPATASIYYGTPLSSTQLNATATDLSPTPSVSVPGTFVYTTTGGATLTNGTVLDAGNYVISAAFSPSNASDYTSASLSNHTLIVMPDPTATALTANPANTPAGQTVTLTAKTTDQYASTQGQTVTFYDGAAVLGTVTIDATGTAVYTINTFSLGSHAIKACLNQTLDYIASCSTLTPETITLPTGTTPTETLIASDVNPSVVGQTVTFTVNVAATGSFNTLPTGTVTFKDGSTILGTSTLTAGVATLATKNLAAGTHNITASYAGTSTMDASASVILVQQVNASLASAGTGFVMTVTPTTFQIGAGSTVNLGITVLEFNNFNLPVKLACNGLPAESTCTFGTDTIPVGGGSTPVTVYVSSPHACGTNTQYFQASTTTRGLPVLALLTFVFFARRRRILKGLALAALLCMIPAVTGCGNCTDLGVRPGAYTFTITGTATTTNATPVVTVPGDSVSGSTVTQTQSMSMTVQL